MSGTAAKLAALSRSLVLEHGDHMARAPIEDCCRSLSNADEARLVILAEGGGTGLAGVLLRTGRPFQVDCAGRDPRYDAAVDAPLGPAEARLLLAPVHDAGGSVAAALVVARHAGAQSPRFSDLEARTLCFAAQQVAAHLSRVRLLHQPAAGSASGSAQPEPPAGATRRRQALFRREALEHYRAPNRGGLLRLSARWATPAYFLLLAAVAAAAVASWVSTLPERAGGPAVLIATEAGSEAGGGLQRQGPRITAQALLPGRYRPRLAPGMELLFTADRFPEVQHRLTIAAVGGELRGPAEVRDLLADRAAAVSPVGAPVVRVEAPVPAGSRVAAELRPGGIGSIWGQAQVVVGEEKLLLKLLPGLRGEDR